MNTYVIDTNLLFNMQADLGLGDKTEHIIRALTKIAKKGIETGQFCIATTPRVVDEIQTFFDDPHQLFLLDFFASLTVKSPDLTTIMVSANFLAEVIEEARLRSLRSMRVSEEEITKAGESFMGKEVLPKKEFQISIGKIIHGFRERYRNSARTGFIDSLTDLGLILLAKESNGILVSSDEGVIEWGRKLGVLEMAPEVFGRKIQAYA